jgi:hypothetical protein
MAIINFIIAVIALILAIFALQRSGGTKDLREKTATALSKMEGALRRMEEKEKKEEGPQSGQ